MTSHGPLRIEVFNDPMFSENGYLLWADGSPECWIIDPGFPPQPDEMIDMIEHDGLKPSLILLTHCHLDHIAGIPDLRERFPNTPIAAPRGEARALTDPEVNRSAMFGFTFTAPPADQLLEPGAVLRLGALEWRALDVSGHSPAGLAYHCAALGVVFVGDALFMDGVGRYDFPDSDGERLFRNIAENLLTLPPETVTYSGHGPETTIGREKKSNPFLSELKGR